MPLAGLALGLLSLRLAGPAVFAGVGSLDASFNAPSPNGSVNAIAVQPDGRLIVAGNFTTLGGAGRVRIARLLENGLVDGTFDPGAGPNNAVTSVALQPDGKLLIAGVFTSVGGIPRNKYARLHGNGSLDPAYAAAQPFLLSGDASQIVALPNGGSLLVGPSLVLFSFSPMLQRSWYLALNTNGACEVSFTNAPMTPTIMLAGAVTLDGKYLVGGQFSTSAGSPRTNLVQLDATGAVDPALLQAPLRPTAFVRAICPMGDGQLVVIDGSAGTNFVRRLNRDGTADRRFTPAHSDAAILCAAVQPDGRIWIGGDFSSINGVPRLKLARLNSDGSLDASYSPGDGTGTSVYALTSQLDGKLLVGGAFNCYNNICLGPVVRLLGDFTAGQPRLVGGSFLVTVATAAGKTYALQYLTSLAGTNWISLPAVAGDGTTKTLQDANPTNTHRIYRAVEY
jgi:uncharacterized delta-60 repeat protein